MLMYIVLEGDLELRSNYIQSLKSKNNHKYGQSDSDQELWLGFKTTIGVVNFIISHITNEENLPKVPKDRLNMRPVNGVIHFCKNKNSTLIYVGEVTLLCSEYSPEKLLLESARVFTGIKDLEFTY